MSSATAESIPTEASDTEPGYVHYVAADPRRQDSIENTRITEDGCWAITEQKKYYDFDYGKEYPVFIKRNLTPSEYTINQEGDLLLPYKCQERMRNEVAAIRYIQKYTTIPTPNIRCAFEDHGRYYIITDVVPGVALASLPSEKKAQVIKEVEGYRTQMHAIKSKVMGGLAGDVILPYRLSEVVPQDEEIKLRDADTVQFVLCHNDLSQHNILVDETTLKVNAIIDWEYAGFFPPEFDGKFYLRPGPSVALEGEADDVSTLLQVLNSWKA
ncbi:kinase-like domain-containing protein [Gymnopilus junonius]|uniref:Kinase-like domain-containing protein n=1 Tax=Gymnopilus junonius TaxID=109634 RepID=A0A9P5TSB5_GYMJU|nr:kinase-like domain-containing protein [Gymnopilus junonius]